ncbi:hypothetical protein ACHAQH_008760 [Verticillium albo-atrum]
MRSLSLDPNSQAPGPVSTGISARHVSDGGDNTSQTQQTLPLPSKPVPYSVGDEEPPGHEFFASPVQDALRIGRQILAELKQSIDPVTQDFEKGGHLWYMGFKARYTLPREGSRIRSIAILGDSGQGKSSLINSLLHLPGIAHTSDNGSACTSVVTEYHQKFPGQLRSFYIDVQYYSGAALEELVKELAWSYRQLYLPDSQKPELTSDREYANYQKESDQAWSALQAAFRHHKDFSAELLRDVSDGAADRINHQLLQWAREIKWPSGGSTSATGSCTRWASTADTAEECCEKTRAFMEDALWPFTKLIQVHLSSPILDSGVILADLPGLNDTNLARVKATQSYLLQCDKILIVSKIARAITDQSVRSAIFSSLARHVPMEWEESGGRKLQLAVVCTGAEDINIKTATSEFVGQGKRITRDVMERLEADIQAAKTSGDHDKKKAAKRKLKYALIAARMEHVTEALQSRYSADTGGHLDVFCVANHAYEKFCTKGNAEIVKISGIPSLRQFCLTITADDRLSWARHLLQSEIPSLLNSADLWASSHMPHGAFDSLDKSNMLQHLDNIRSEVPRLVTRLKDAFVDCFKEQIMALWTTQEPKWRTAAIDESKGWETWRWSMVLSNSQEVLTADTDLLDSYNAWCRHNGKYSTPVHENIDWNSQIIWKMRMELAFQWEIVEEEVPAVFAKLTEDLSKELTWLKDDTIMQASATAHRDMLISSVDAIDRLWKYNVNLEEQKLARGTTHIKNQASESNETSYILSEMLGAYRAASSHSGAFLSTTENSRAASEEDVGNRIFELQKADIGGHIGGEAFFSNIAIRMLKDVEALAQRTEDSVNMLVKQVMERLEYDIKMALKEGELADGAENSVTHLKRDVDRLKERWEAIPKF